jgi:hypothetical protein
MNRGRETPVEAGCVGGCIGVFAAVCTIPLGLMIYVIALVLGDNVSDGNLGFGVFAVPLAILGAAAVAYVMAARSGGHSILAGASAMLGFVAFWVAVFAGAGWLDPA